jgi:hypothetical protein
MNSSDIARRQAARATSRRLTIRGLRRAAFVRPLAVTLAFLLTPLGAPQWFERLAPALASILAPATASAQVIGCRPGGNTVIQNYCVDGVVYYDDLRQLEGDAVRALLGFHKLPVDDASVVYALGRADLRNEIRAFMVEILEGIIRKQPAARTTHEQNLYNWLQALVRQNEVALYTNAVNEYQRWRTNPCGFILDPAIASANGLSYDGAPFCASPLNSLFGGPPVPAESYFTAFGMRKSYGAASETIPNFASLVAESSVNVGLVAGSIAAAYTLIAAAAVPAVAASITSAAAAASSLSVTLGGEAIPMVFVVSAGATEAVGVVSLIAGPVAIILIAITIGVTAGLQVFNNETTLNNLNNLSTKLTAAQTAPPDLLAMVNDTTGLGFHKLISTVTSQTVPDAPSSAPLPAHRPGTDWNFAIDNTTADTLTYRDWEGRTWSAQTWGGWFVKHCTSGADCPQSDSISGTLRYIDWEGVRWSAMRLGDTFVSTRAQVRPTDVNCPSDTFTGTDVSNCRSYASKGIPLTDGNGSHVRAALSPFNAPLFTGSASLPFTPTVASTQAVVATGNPAPVICVSSTNLPAEIVLNGGSCGVGTFNLAFDGAAGVARGRFALTLTADNGIGAPVSKTFTVDVDEHVSITSPDTLTGTAGQPINFLITTTGNPKPTLTLDPLVGLGDLVFRDNGDGTATISGTTRTGFGFLGCSEPCGIRATNGVESVLQPFFIKIAEPPRAYLAPPVEAQFTAGLENRFQVRTTNNVTPIDYWQFSSPDAAPWLRLEPSSFEAGTATLVGTPPAGTSGRFTFGLTPVAAGTLPVSQTFTLEVRSGPVFSSPNTTTFTVGTANDFAITANVGTIGLVGTLPRGLAFSGGAAARISGTPAAGFGGLYPVTLTNNAGALGNATQDLLVRVLEGAAIKSDRSATFVAGTPGSFAVTTTGYPSVSMAPVTTPAPPTSPEDGLGMYFTVSGLPASLQATNLGDGGFATGTLTIAGTPSAGDAGVHQVVITAYNGVGAIARQTLALNVIAFTAPAPASGTRCNGYYNGTFRGSLMINAGQTCVIIGGGVTGSVLVNGGTLVLDRAAVGGNLQATGRSTLTVADGTTIGGNLTMAAVFANASSQVCGATVNGNLQLGANVSPVQIGSGDNTCAGNTIKGNAELLLNVGPTQVFNNVVSKNLSCQRNTTITGGGNVAGRTIGQCNF